VSEDVQEVSAEPVAPAVRRRGLRLVLWLAVAAVLLGAGAVTAIVAQRDHWLDAHRQITMHQLNVVGHPVGFHSVAATRTDAGPAGWDGHDGLGRRYYDGRLRPDQLTAALNFWLGRAGLLSPDGPRESQRCGRIARTDVFGCGNFYRETPTWRVWITVTGDGWPGHVVPAARVATFIHVGVVVERKRTLAQSFVPIALSSPGFTGTLGAGRDRTVLTLSATQTQQVDLDGATFGPHGELVTAGPGLPVVIPAAAGATAQLLDYSSWPSVPHEYGPVAANATSSDTARIGPDGSLWVHLVGAGLRRLNPDGHATNIAGVASGDGQLADAPAVGQDPYTVGEPTAISADGTVWVANGQLIRIRNGKLHIIDPGLLGVDSVASDGHNGVYFGTATQVFHLTGQGSRRPIGEQAHFSGVTSLAVARDGSLFVLDGSYLRRVLTNGAVDEVAGRGGTVAGRDDPVFCAKPVPPLAATLPVSAAYDVIASPLGGVYLTGCNRLVQVGY
jgi:hypothetical protein